MENQDALNLEGDQDTNLENEGSDNNEELVKTKEYAKNQKIRAEKAEQELKFLRSKIKETSETETPKNEEKKQSNEPDYAKLAFLETKGVSHPDDQKIVQDEANRLNLPLTDVLGMEHIKTKLKSAQLQREAEIGMPSGSGKSSGSAKNSVDYWIDRKKADGSYDTPPDIALANQVIDARMKRDVEGNKFSDELF